VVKPFAKSHRSVEETQSCHGREEVELAPRGPTAEALVNVMFQVRGEGSAARRGGMVDGTGTTDLISGELGKREANQVEDIRQRDHGADFSETDTWHSGDFTVRGRHKTFARSKPRSREEEPVFVRKTAVQPAVLKQELDSRNIAI